MTDAEPTGSERTSLTELALLFLRLGATAFGGPAVHIAMMQDEVVRRRRWFDEQRFLDLLGVTNLIPGPNSTELAIHIGWDRRGFAGLIVAGLAFILPASLITGGLGWAYSRYGSLPTADWLLYGVKPVIVAILVQALASLAPKAARTGWLRTLTAFAIVMTVLGANEVAVLIGAGALGVARQAIRSKQGGAIHQFVPMLPLAGGALGVGSAPLASLFFVFLKAGSLLFGSGYVLLAFLRADLVERLGWLTEKQLIDAIAVGQVTPGPVFTTATFVGFVVAGPSGALVATLGIFLPAFVFVALSGPIVPKLRASKAASAFLDGVNAASLALFVVVSYRLARAALVDANTAVLALGAAVALLRFQLNATWIVMSGAAAGYLLGRCQ